MALKVMTQKRPGELTSAKEVVEATGCPFDATARVLQLMAQKGILRSEHGAYGGYLVIRDLSRVSFLELMELVLGPMTVARCLHGVDSCELKGSCNIISPVAILNRKVEEFYRQLSVGELLRVKDREPQEANLIEVMR